MTGAGPALFAGHDVGTGGTKAALVDATGAVHATAFAPYPLDHPRPGWAEQDPEDWWRAVAATTRALLAGSGADARQVAGVAVAGQMLALAPLGADGAAVRPALSWLDGRAAPQAARLVRRLGGERVVSAVVGAVPSGKDIVAKIAWIREHEPDAYARTLAFCDATGYVVARATGRVGIDPTGAAGTGLLDRRRRRWSPLLARLTGVPLGVLPPVVPSHAIAGRLTPEAAAATGLAAGTPVVAGAGDVPAAALGAGALAPGAGHVCLGTSAWLCAAASRPRDLPRAGVYALPSPDPDAFLMVGESETAGACVQWAARLLGCVDPAGRPDHERLEALAATVAPARPHAPAFAPWLFGERAPVTDAALRGALTGLTLEHGPADVARAVFDGLAANMAWLAAEYGDALPGGRPLRALGGGTRSAAWTQAVADATGRPLEVVAHSQEAGAVGAALLAAVGTGALPDVPATADVIRTTRRVAPRPEATGAYAALERRLRGLAQTLPRAATA